MSLFNECTIRSSPNQQGAASVIRLKADSTRIKEVYKELSMFITNKNSNGRMVECTSSTS